ncbi:hypothetical protein TELCIR_15612 [Teladorsagia circumcincta]|uniref:Uncharacterized protein n=1 Tax=Teladorsagia circumcincta TaxID=45464 RepID=A0A2G9TY00_TELCI|nr:hypothetical protein TELCIR_15612 [Teladorsagia circumcincta]
MPRSKRYPVQADEHVSLHGSPLSFCFSLLRFLLLVYLPPFAFLEIFSHAALAVDPLLKLSTNEGRSTESNGNQSTLAPDIAYVKLSAMVGKPSPKKRVYFNDVSPAEGLPSKKPTLDVKQLGAKYRDSALSVTSRPSNEGRSSDNLVEQTEERSEMLMEPTIDVDSYEEVTVSEEYDDSPAGVVSSSYLTPEGREVLGGNSYRELKGENNYLKEQLQASMLR